MAITTPNDYEPLGQESFMLADMPGPLDTILKNTNYLYRYHRPPMLSVAYTSAVQIAGRTARFTIPAKPSVDGLVYEFTSKILATAAVGWQLTVQIETYDAINGWQVLSTAATAQVAGGDQVLTDTQTGIIARQVTLIRTSYSGTNGAQLTPHHLLVIPTPAAVVTGIKLSGFVPYDDGQLSTSGAVTTEHVNRAQANAISVLQDRAQCAFAWVQEDTPADMVFRPGLGPFTTWRQAPSVKVGLPGQLGPMTLDCAILAGTTRGTGAVRLQQSGTLFGGLAFEAAADGVVHTGSCPIVANAGGPEASATLAVSVKVNDPLALMDIYAVIAWWRPTV